MTQDEVEQHFESPRQLIERAEKHLLDLDNEIRQWRKSKNFALVSYRAEDGSGFLYILRITDDLPSIFSVIAFDIFNALRAALDQAIYACIKCFGRVSPPRKSHFPFAPDAQGVLVALRTGQSKDVPAEIQPLLCAFEPHAGGNRRLWALNQMRNIKSHRFLLEPSINTNGIQLILKIPPGGTESCFPGKIAMRVGEWQEELDGIEILQSDHMIEPYYDLEITVDIAIGDIEPLRGMPVVGVFRDLIPEVQRIVSEIEAETIMYLCNPASTP